MKRKICTKIFCLLAMLTLTGCQLALDGADSAMGEDRLAGIFLTAQYLDLFDYRAYFNDNPMSIQGGNMTVDGDTSKYQGRLYAQLITKPFTNEETGETSETVEYVFPVDGVSFFSAFVPAKGDQDSYITSISDPAISDGHVDYKIGDEGSSTTLTGTIYASPQNLPRTYYINPVYQSADGSVYTVSSGGFTVTNEAISEGALFSQTLDATTTETSTSIQLTISVMFAPEKISVIQMDEKSAVLSQKEYAPDAMPESITTESETSYLIVETHKRDVAGQIIISREIYGSDVDNFKTFYAGANGIDVTKWTALKWTD
ncbi:MAG: hypothetical protein LBM69_01630 [Lachnospiraceae bacterium]|nr:hypothetical protein [Lachnospiraceae bacterium]